MNTANNVLKTLWFYFLCLVYILKKYFIIKEMFLYSIKRMCEQKLLNVARIKLFINNEL